MSDDFVIIKPVGPAQNINRLTPADKDKEKHTKNLYKKNENENTDRQDQTIEPDLTPNEPTDNSSDGHLIDIKA